MSMKYLIFNQKAYLNYEDVIILKRKLKRFCKKIIIAPSNVYIPYFKKKFVVCAQDLSSVSNGAYTGEVTGEQLKSMDVKYTLIGHSERRQYFDHDNQEFVNKIRKAQEAKIKVIYCVGEDTKENYEQLNAQLELVKDCKDIIIAYEPYYMIDSNKKIDVEYINNTLDYIRNYFEIQPDIIYGGSVNLENLDSLKQLKTNGYIIGSCSTNFEAIKAIVNILC